MLRLNLQKFYPVCLMIILLVGAAAAQSGRKGNKTPTPPPQTQTGQQSENEKGTEEIKTESVSANTPKLSKTSLQIAVDIPQSLYFQFRFPDKMGEWVFDRLRKASTLEVGMMGSDLNRVEVIKRAKNETQSLSVLLELEENMAAGESPNRRKAQNENIWINYHIYLPGTGKVKSQGRAYLRQSSVITRRTDVLGISCYPGVRGDDLLLLRASIEIADRIMSDLSVRIPPVCSSGY